MVRNLQDYRWSRLIDWVCVAHEKNYCRKMRDDGLMYCSAKPDEEEKMDLNNGFTSFHLTPIHICGSMSLCTWCSSRLQKRTQLFLDKNKPAIAVIAACFCRTCRHKHTAAKYSCHSILFCTQNLVIYESDNSILQST